MAADAADAALKAVKQKGWKPSEDLRKAGEQLPPKMVVLGVVDPREILPAVLASLPGTLQTMINATIVLRSRMAAAAGNAPGGPAAGRAGMAAGGPAMGPGGRGGAMGPGARRRHGGPAVAAP